MLRYFLRSLYRMGSSDDEQQGNEDDLTASPKKQQSKKRKSRGSTTLPDIIKAKSSGVKKVIQYNDKGQPMGVNRAKYASYLGVLARTLVPISNHNWFKVTPQLKDKLWRSVEVYLTCVFRIQFTHLFILKKLFSIIA